MAPDQGQSPTPSRAEQSLWRSTVHIWSIALGSAPAHLAAHALLAVGLGAIPVVVAWLTKLLVDGLVDGSEAGASLLAATVTGLAAAFILSAALPHGQAYLDKEVGRRMSLTVRERLFTALDKHIGLGRFEDPRFHDRLLLAQQAGQSGPQEVLNGVLALAQGTTTLAGLLGSLLFISPLMAGVVLLAGVPAFLAEVALSRRRARLLLRLSHAERREFFFSHLLTDVDAAKEIRLFRLGRFFRDLMLTELWGINRHHRSLDRRELATQSALALLSTSLSIAGLAWAVGSASAGRLSVGDVMLFLGAVVGTQTALRGVTDQVAHAYHALLLFGHWTAVVHATPDLPVPDRPRKLAALRHGIELRDVWFRYSEHHAWVLRGVNLSIPHGRSIALVGHNGQGKSTIVKLLCRLYDPTRGAILWDGVDLREFDPSQLRDHIAAVFQDYMAYDLTAGENIALGNLSALGDANRIEESARFAGVHDVLAALPGGYDTALTRVFFSEGDRADATTGVVLSGGQWQRVALARAVIRGHRDLLILDEPSFWA